jgi:hypothetical protein
LSRPALARSGTAPAQVVRMSTAVPNHDEWYEEVHGIPRPNWTLFDNWITTEADAEAFDEAWDAMVENWLHRIARALGPQYSVGKSDHFLMLTPHSENERKHMLIASEHAHDRVTRDLQELCMFHYGRVLSLRFIDPDHYARFIAHHEPVTGDEPGSAGVFLSEGFPHLACYSRSFEEFRKTVAHELSHFYVAHLPLPRWVNEGVAMTMESDGGNIHLPRGKAADEHFEYWTPDTIQNFWYGDSWREGHEAFALSYQLAAVIFDIIRSELHPSAETRRAFIRDAHRNDAGVASIREHLRVDLGEVAGVFLGSGDWSPRP